MDIEPEHMLIILGEILEVLSALQILKFFCEGKRRSYLFTVSSQQPASFRQQSPHKYRVQRSTAHVCLFGRYGHGR